VQRTAADHTTALRIIRDPEFLDVLVKCDHLLRQQNSGGRVGIDKASVGGNICGTRSPDDIARSPSPVDGHEAPASRAFLSFGLDQWEKDGVTNSAARE
jgi:hypothetical protein